MKYGFDTDLFLERAYQRGWLSGKYRAIAQDLMQEGLHPEQALIGCGFLTVDQYADCLSELANLPFVRLERELIVRDHPLQMILDQVHGVVLSDDETGILIGLVIPHQSIMQQILSMLADEQRQVQWYLILESEWQKDIQSFKPRRYLDRASFFDPVFFAARKQRLERRSHWFGFRFSDDHEQVLGDSSHSDRAHEWSFIVRAFLQKPSGLLVALRPSAEVRRRLSFPFEPFVPEDEDSTHPVWCELNAHQDEECLLHRALFDLPTVVFTQDDSFLRRLSQRGLSASVLERHLSASASEVYSCYPV